MRLYHQTTLYFRKFHPTDEEKAKDNYEIEETEEEGKFLVTKVGVIQKPYVVTILPDHALSCVPKGSRIFQLLRISADLFWSNIHSIN